MPLLSSSSSLIAFDKSNENNSEDYEYLFGVQNLNLRFKSNLIDKNFLGNNKPKFGFIPYEVILDFSYVQTVSFLHETLFGFIESSANENEKYRMSIFYSLFNGFLNKNALILFDDKIFASDLFNKIAYSDYNSDLFVFSLGNLFLQSYSFSYSVGTLPIVNCSFISSLIKITNPFYLHNKFSFLNCFSETNNLPNKDQIENFLGRINKLSKDKNLISLSLNKFNLKNLNLDKVPIVKLNDFENSAIQTLNFEINLERENIYEFSSIQDNIVNRIDNIRDRKLINPCSLIVTLSGFSLSFNSDNIGSIDFRDYEISFEININKKDFEFKIGNDEFSKLTFTKLKVEDFSYSIDIGNVLNYSLRLSSKITDLDGLFLNKIPAIESLDKPILLSSDSNVFKTKDNKLMSYL